MGFHRLKNYYESPCSGMTKTAADAYKKNLDEQCKTEAGKDEWVSVSLHMPRATQWHELKRTQCPQPVHEHIRHTANASHDPTSARMP